MSDTTTPRPRLDARLDKPLSRWRWLIKCLLVIPHVIVLVFLWLAAIVLTVVAGFAILFTAWPLGAHQRSAPRGRGARNQRSTRCKRPSRRTCSAGSIEPASQHLIAGVRHHRGGVPAPSPSARGAEQGGEHGQAVGWGVDLQGDTAPALPRSPDTAPQAHLRRPT
jgi:hypothetical protein